MNANTWGRWVSRLFQQRRRGRPLPAQRRLAFESLEDRVVPATIIWQGDSGSLWSTPGNWNLNRAPLAGDDLVFGSTGAGTTRNTLNDLASLPAFSSITISASGYTLAGSAPRIVLTGGINVGSDLGTESITTDLQLLAPAGTLQQTITVIAARPWSSPATSTAATMPWNRNKPSPRPAPAP